MSYRGSDLFEETSLWKIFFISCRQLSPSKFNTWTTVLLFLILTFHVFLNPSDSGIIAIVRALVEAGLNFSASILGFLIAGFTIFATLTKPTLLVKMYSEIHKESKLNYLKHNFFAFMQVFATLLFFLAVCVLFKILGSPGGAVTQIFSYLHKYSCLPLADVRIVIVNTAYVFIGTLFYYSVTSLKSFIFNVYHVIITSVVWELNSEKPNDDQDN